MRLVWDSTIFPKQQDEEGSNCNGTSSDLHPMEIRRKRTESFLPSQTVAEKDQVEDPAYTLTIGYLSALPSSLLIDTSAQPSDFATTSTISSSISSSFALCTNLPMIAVIGPPVAMLLPQLN